MPGETDSTALVRMGSVSEAELAIEALNGSHFSGQSCAPPPQTQVPVSGIYVPPLQRATPGQTFLPASRPGVAHHTGNKSVPLTVRYQGSIGGPPSDNLYVKGLPL